MQKFFENKKISFIGDSNLSHGYYIYNLRSFISRDKAKCFIYNGGVSGLKAALVYEDLLKEEVFDFNSDYCAIILGTNDVGIWLYDSFKKADDKLLKERMERNQEFFNGIKNIIKLLCDKGVKPILISPFPVNELIEEKPDIPTIGDNREKAKLIDNAFYKRKTFQNINCGLENYNEFLKEFCAKNNILFFNIFEKLKYDMFTFIGLYKEDGIHFSELGGKYIARHILNCLGYECNSVDFVKDDINDKIINIEQKLRHFAYVKHGHFNPLISDCSYAEIIKKVNEIILDTQSPVWLKNNCIDFLEIKDIFIQKKEEYNKQVNKYLNN